VQHFLAKHLVLQQCHLMHCVHCGALWCNVRTNMRGRLPRTM
jgi:hypothetical protein